MKEKEMKDENKEVEEEEFEQGGPEADFSEPEQEPERDTEAEEEARKYGWRSRDEYDRAPEGWVDASRFLELPSTHVKKLRDENKAQAAEFQQRLEAVERVNKIAQERALENAKRQHESELQQIREQKRKAAESVDMVQYDQLASRENELLGKQPQPQQPPGPDPVVQDYISKNEWLQDPDMRAEAADIIDRATRIGHPFPTPISQVEYAEQAMKRRYPHLFQAQQPRQAPSSRTESGGLATGAKRGRGADDLPPEAKRAAKQFVDDGIYKNMAEYAADYFAQEGAR